MITNTEYVRLIIKNSNDGTQIPTIPTTTDINEFKVTDILESELFFNSGSKTLFSRSGNDIVELIGGSNLIIQTNINNSVTCNPDTDLLVLDAGSNSVEVTMPTLTSPKVITIKQKGTGSVLFDVMFDGVPVFLSSSRDRITVYYNDQSSDWKIKDTVIL